MKKFISILLTISIVLTTLIVLPMSASAATDGDYTYDVYNNEAKITGYTGSGGAITIPSTLGGYPVTSIGSSAFYDCESLTSVTIPDSVTSIGSDAFNYCSGIARVYASDIEKWCKIDFEDMYSNPLYYNAKLYLNHKAATSISIPETVTEIKSYAFYNCENITSVEIPDSVMRIGIYAFENTGYYNNSSNWENKVLYIGNHLIRAKVKSFPGDDELSGECKIKEGTKTISDAAFGDCYRLTSVEIPNSVTSIGNYAFYNCTSLTSVEIPNSVTSIGRDAFYRCSSLTSVEIPDSVTSIGYGTFYYCSDLNSITIPNSVESIGDEAFNGCTNLTEVYYDGTKKEWDNIEIGKNNEPLKIAKIICLKDRIADIVLDKVQSVKTNNETYATMRFFFIPTYNSGTVTAFGAYIVPLWIFDQRGMQETALVKKNGRIDSGKSYSADLTEIPSTAFDEEMFAVPFIMFGEEAVIITDTDLYENNTVNNKDINK